MSTLKVAEIRNASSATGGLSIAADGVVSGALPYPNRNLLYNGAMQVAQRGTSVSGVTTGQVYRTVDRFYLAAAGVGFGTVTESVETDAPTGSGFRKSYKTLWTTGKTPLAASDLLLFRQILEGQDLQRIAKGTSSAQQLTLSFWVKSNVTGTYVARLEDTDNSRHVAATYSVNASGTWEKKTITFPADTTGAFDNDNAGSLRVDWVLAVGTDWTSGTLPAAWGSYLAANLAPGQTNVAAATNNYWQVTGVQLEVGDTATEFEFKSYGQELRECQRYYWRAGGDDVFQRYGHGINTSTTRAIVFISVPMLMRAKPSAIESASLALVETASAIAATSVTTNRSMRNGVELFVDVASGLTANRPVVLSNNSTTAGYLAFSAEL